jgi:hypothetical protein
MMSPVETQVQVNGAAESSGENGGSKEARAPHGSRALRTAAATLELIRAGDRSLRVLQVGSPDTSLAPLCPEDDEIAALDPHDPRELPAEDFDCAVSVDSVWRLSGDERRAHLDTLRSTARIVLVEAPLDSDDALEDVGRYFEEQGDWTATISEERLAELEAISALDAGEAPEDAVESLSQALDDLAEGAEAADRGVLVAVADRSIPGFDLEPLRTPSGDRETLPATLPLALEIHRANDRLAAAEQRARKLELQLARREGQIGDMSTKLAELSLLASNERRARRRLEHELEVAQNTRGYRLGHRFYRLRTRVRAGLRAVGRGIAAPFRAVKRKLARSRR